MPRGFTGISAKQEEIEERRKAAQERDKEKIKREYFKLPNHNDSATVRFLEQGEDVHYCTVHELPKEGSLPWNIPCRNQDDDGSECPACEAGLKKRFKGYINLINRETNQVEVWAQGINVFQELEGKDATYKGLCSRDFKITRKGLKLDTKYTIEPADPDGGAKPPSAADKKLAKNKYDLNELVTPPSVERWEKLLGAPDSSEEEEAGEATVGDRANPRANPFL
jgi:hypothetical protein